MAKKLPQDWYCLGCFVFRMISNVRNMKNDQVDFGRSVNFDFGKQFTQKMSWTKIGVSCLLLKYTIYQAIKKGGDSQVTHCREVIIHPVRFITRVCSEQGRHESFVYLHVHLYMHAKYMKTGITTSCNSPVQGQMDGRSRERKRKREKAFVWYGAAKWGEETRVSARGKRRRCNESSVHDKILSLYFVKCLTQMHTWYPKNHSRAVESGWVLPF